MSCLFTLFFIFSKNKIYRQKLSLRMDSKNKKDTTEIENQEWIDSFNWIIKNKSTKRASELLEILEDQAKKHQVLNFKEI